MIKCSINVSKLDKTKFVKGAKGTYCDITLIETPNGQYGDYMIVQDVTKEERMAGTRGAILGNGKVFEKKQPEASSPEPTGVPAPSTPDPDSVTF